jgi:biotin--protein ligase
VANRLFSFLVLGAGCGVNILNSRPTTSLSELTSLSNPTSFTPPTLEASLAKIMTKFESMWETFTKPVSEGGGFEAFIRRYEDRWLHS